MLLTAPLLMATALAGPPPAAPQPAAVAVSFDRKGTRTVVAEGMADRETGRKVTADDPVRIASISKLVTAMGVMRLVDQGKLDLDRDVSDYLGWKLRHPGFPDKPITLAMLLSHQSGLLDGPDLYIIPLDMTLRERLSDPRVWDAAHAPGSGWFHYTNLNFPVVASVMERATGERFDRLMARLVLGPLRLDACFNWGDGCSPAMIKRAVVLYRSTGEVAKDDLQGRRPDCLVVPAADSSCDLASYRPGDNGALFSPQGGLRISMKGLARLGQTISGNAANGFLSQPSYSRMFKPVWTFDGANGLGEDGESGFFCAYGLAAQRLANRQEGCRDDPFGDGVMRFGHSGDAYGLKAGLWFDPWTGRGVAYFTSAVPDGDKGARSAFTSREESLIDRLPR
ncbi:serine hydrolase domain-containing protein [Novosphingobium sp.]|uniref:serine hydrolase domain-containing protein n=1 Tax=Novosphingobium sp. TaxID=1874826 RepID=UPI00286E5261|nr:serine hydrolase domain-containing protein [Novosphingobium sp.]